MENPEQLDPSIPHIKFTEPEREEMHNRGMSDEAIDQEEARRNLDLAESKVKEELREEGLEDNFPNLQ